jgi:hypothetical protein
MIVSLDVMVDINMISGQKKIVVDVLLVRLENGLQI